MFLQRCIRIKNRLLTVLNLTIYVPYSSPNEKLPQAVLPNNWLPWAHWFGNTHITYDRCQPTNRILKTKPQKKEQAKQDERSHFIVLRLTEEVKGPAFTRPDQRGSPTPLRPLAAVCNSVSYSPSNGVEKDSEYGLFHCSPQKKIKPWSTTWTCISLYPIIFPSLAKVFFYLETDHTSAGSFVFLPSPPPPQKKKKKEMPGLIETPEALKEEKTKDGADDRIWRENDHLGSETWRCQDFSKEFDAPKYLHSLSVSMSIICNDEPQG